MGGWRRVCWQLSDISDALISQKQFIHLHRRWRIGGGGKPQYGTLAVMIASNSATQVHHLL